MVGRSHGQGSRLALILAAVVGVLAIVGTYLVLRPSGSAPTSAAARSGCVPLEVNVSSEKGFLVADLADRYNRSDRTFGGKCAAVSVHVKTSGAAMQALAAGWDPKRDGAPVPQVWAPTASLWLGLLRQQESAADRPTLPDTPFPSIAQSPLTIAMPKPMAQALGWPSKQLGWADILALSSDPRGWAAYGHPEWGRFTFGKDNPHQSTSGLAATIATYYAATGRSSDLTDADLTDPKVTSFVHGVEQGVLHYSDDAVKFLSNLADADAKGEALNYVSAVVMQEELAYLYNSGDPTADPAKLGNGRKPQVPVVTIYPKEGTLMLDHPYVVLPGATDDQKAAAADFLAFLQLPAQQQRFASFGFRDYRGQPSTELAQSIGVPAGQKLSLIDPPSPEVLAKILQGWDTLRKNARVLLVIDVSGSMNESAGGGLSKLEAAKQAAIQGLTLLSPQDEVALWSFSTPIGDNPSPYTQLVPFSPIGTAGDRIDTAIKGLHANGGTALYATVRDAQRYAVSQLSDDRITAVVVLTDGKNEYPQDDDLNALLRDIDASNLELSVRVFGIAFGSESNLDALSQIAKASKATAYDARDPSTINNVFVSVLSNF
jgi:Ca-activated chloride channel family protein